MPPQIPSVFEPAGFRDTELDRNPNQALDEVSYSRATRAASAARGSTSKPVARSPDQLTPSSNPSRSRPSIHRDRHSMRGIATVVNPAYAETELMTVSAR